MKAPFGLMVARLHDSQSVPYLVDLGYVKDKKARDCCDRMIAAGLGRKNISIEGFSRLLVRLPPKHTQKFIKRFRFVKGDTYWQCTHHRAGLARPTDNPEQKEGK